MPSQSRKHRGYKTQDLVAQWFAARGWPYAQSTGAGRSGNDVTGLPGIGIEIKARTGFEPLAWLRQAKAGAREGEIPAAVFRCNGQGEASVADFGVLVTLATFTDLLRRAGYGEPTNADQSEDAA